MDRKHKREGCTLCPSSVTGNAFPTDPKQFPLLWVEDPNLALHEQRGTKATPNSLWCFFIGHWACVVGSSRAQPCANQPQAARATMHHLGRAQSGAGSGAGPSAPPVRGLCELLSPSRREVPAPRHSKAATHTYPSHPFFVMVGVSHRMEKRLILLCDIISFLTSATKCTIEIHDFAHISDSVRTRKILFLQWSQRGITSKWKKLSSFFPLKVHEQKDRSEHKPARTIKLCAWRS